MYIYNYFKDLLRTYTKKYISNKSNSVGIISEYMDIGIINPSIGTSNLGDLIIYQSVERELRLKYPFDFFTDFPSQLHTNYEGKKLMSEKDVLFISGTNLLRSDMDQHSQWKIDPGHKLFLKNKVLLVGVGWWQYQHTPNKYTIELYKSIFKEDSLHSVRDSYTLQMLNDIGITNVINTSCPTLWKLNAEHCKTISQHKCPNVVTTLTFYKANPVMDRKMLDILVDNYEKVFLWVQGLDDIIYLHKIFPRSSKIILIAPTVEAFNDILEDQSVEYIGTRLHAGIMAIQKKVRTLIIAVDNRAIEISRDTNLNVIDRNDDIESIFDFIEGPYVTKLNLPTGSIIKWRQSLPNKILK